MDRRDEQPQTAGEGAAWRVLDHVPMPVAVFDREMRYVAHNALWATSYQKEGEGSLVGRSHYEVFPDTSEDWRAVHARGLAGVTERRDLDVFVRADGRKQHMRWIVAPWFTDGGAIGGIVITSEDLTEREEMRQQLAQNEATGRMLFERSPIGLNLCRMDGLWLRSNPAFLSMIGYSPEEANSALSYWQLTPPEYNEEEQRQLSELRERQRYGPYEKEFIRKDGTRVPVRLNGFVIAVEGQDHIWSFIEDITRQRKLEAELEEEHVRAIHASKLATLGELSATVAHEINNPLQIVASYISILQQMYTDRDEAGFQEAMSAIDRATARAATIVKSLQRFARRTGEEAPKAVAVQELVADAVTLCRAHIRPHGVRLTCNTQSDARVTVRGIDLSQVLVNLLNNAFDAASGADPWIRVSIVDDPVNANDVEIWVEDSGPGVPKHQQEKIFRSFFTTKPQGAGTGLGLSMSRSIVERYGGTLVYDDRATCTRFVVHLPKAKEL